jgi:hypothetical protein
MEEKEEDDDGDWDADEPQQDSTHGGYSFEVLQRAGVRNVPQKRSAEAFHGTKGLTKELGLRGVLPVHVRREKNELDHLSGWPGGRGAGNPVLSRAALSASRPPQ